MKKIMALILAISMVLSMMSVSVLADGDSNETDAVALIGNQYYSTLDKALADAANSTEENVEITVLKDVTSIPAPTRAGLTFKAADGVKVTSRVNPPRFNPIDGEVKYVGFDFTTYDTGNGCFACFDGGHNLEGLEVVFEDCAFGGEKSVGIWGWATAEAMEKITLDNCTIEDGSKLYFTFGKVNNIVVENCDFSNHTAGNAIIQMPEYAGNLTVTNCDFGKGFINYAPNQGDFERSIEISNCTFDGTKAVNVHSNFTNSSIAWNEVAFTDNVMGDITPAFAFPANVDADEYIANNATTFTFENNATIDGEEVTDLTVPVNAVAYVNGVYYASLQDAITAAQSGDTINLLGKTAAITESAYTPASWLNVGGKTLTFEDGAIDFTGANVSDSIFRLTNGEDVTFDNVDIIRNATEPAVDTCYFVSLQSSNAKVSFVNCDINVADIDYNLVCNYSGNQHVLFENCDITLAGDMKMIQGGGTVIKDSTVYAPDSYIFWAINADSRIINSNIITAGIRGGAAALTIEDNSTVVADTVFGSTENVITVEEGSSLAGKSIDLALINDATAGSVVTKADELVVEFVESDDAAEEGTLLYDINLVGANEETINRLNSADLTFKLVSTSGENVYEIIESNNEVEINPVNNSKDRYEFHFDGKDAVQDTANTITIGQVKFTGYGAFTFGVDADAVETNAAHATTIMDNIVDSFTTKGGTLVIDGVNSTVNTTIKVPTRKLIVDVCFPNAVDKKVADYQDMTVTVSGGDLAEDIVVALGDANYETAVTGYNERPDAKYTVTVGDCYVVAFENALTVNNSYTVTVSGAGYRTARYTVTMTNDKQLNFWNNVMDEAQVVEIGKDSSAVKVTFLAGDIVKDNKINIYDLSAVVSYFGTETETDSYDAYAKYDLNRDGVIDSKDVAYVLVSWGN